MTRISTVHGSTPFIGILKRYKGRKRKQQGGGFLKRGIKKRVIQRHSHKCRRRWIIRNTMPIKGAVNNQSLCVFPITPTDLSMAHYRYVKVPAQTFSITPIHVYMDQQPDLINLTRSFVKLNMAFKTTGNANLTSHAYAVVTMLILTNNIAHTLFKQINRPFPARGHVPRYALATLNWRASSRANTNCMSLLSVTCHVTWLSSIEVQHRSDLCMLHAACNS